MNIWEIRKKDKKLVISIGIFFIALSVLIYESQLQNGVVDFVMGLMACFSIILIMMNTFSNGRQYTIFKFLTKYTMPIFLMHTLFAATFRIVLLKIGIQNVFLHVILGIIISFFGPIFTAIVIKKTKYLEVFFYPRKYIKIF